MISVFDRVENIVGKGVCAGYQHFLLFPQCFQKASFSGSLKVRIVWLKVNSLPKDTILNQSKFKAFADKKIKVNKKLKLVLERVETIVGKGENAGLSASSLFPIMFSKGFFPSVVKSRDCLGKS